MLHNEVQFNTGGRGEMRKAPISLQDLRRRLYMKVKTEPTWRFWGLYVHVCKQETLREAYRLAKSNDGAPRIDSVTFAAVEADGAETFLDQLRKELATRTYRPQRAGKVEIAMGGGKMRQLSAGRAVLTNMRQCYYTQNDCHEPVALSEFFDTTGAHRWET